MGSTNTSTRPGGGRIGRSILAASMSVAAIAASVTGAYFTDSDANADNTFATGSVELLPSKTTAIVTQANMAPGDDPQTGSITVTNDGSLELRYALSSVTDEDVLAAQLDLTVWAETDETSSDGNCATTAPATVLYGADDLGSQAGINVIGDPTGGSQDGDRTLAAAASELLCFRVELPASTDSTFEGLTTTATFTFDAEQTANNA